MKSLNLKIELQKLIEQEHDISLLQAIRTLLQKNRLHPILKQKLTQRALQSEKDIKAGRVYSKEEVMQRMKLSLDE